MIVLPVLAIGLAYLDATELDATVAKLYQVISGPAGQKRDWEAFRALFAEEAKMRVVVTRDAKSRVVILSPDDYVTRSGPRLEQDGFFEKESKRTAVVYGDLAHVWSSYEARMKAEDAQPFMRGVNSLQLAKVDGTWKILSIVWTSEHDAGVPPPSSNEANRPMRPGVRP